jgi:major membrane immunogen (membrane-anchored lipoprotein)
VADAIEPDYYHYYDDRYKGLSNVQMSHRSIPSCNSYEYAEGKCKVKSLDGDYHDP